MLEICICIGIKNPFFQGKGDIQKDQSDRYVFEIGH